MEGSTGLDRGSKVRSAARGSCRKLRSFIALAYLSALAVAAAGTSCSQGPEGTLKIRGGTGSAGSGKQPVHGTVTAGNSIYQVHVEDIPGFGRGLYTATTGPAHPAGGGLNVLFGGGLPGTSFNTIRSYSTGTDYVQDPFNSSPFVVVWLDPYGSVTSIGTTGFRTTYRLPGPPVTPDSLTILSDVNVNGTTFGDSTIEVTTTIINDGADPVDVGVRYLWDFQIGDDDGPTFQELNPIGGVRVNESEFFLPAFESYRIVDNDINPAPPTLNILGTVTGPPTIVPTPTAPDLLQSVCWVDAIGTAFEYAVNPSRDIATTGSNCSGFSGGDSAVLYFFGQDRQRAIPIAPGADHTVSASLFLTPPAPPGIPLDIKPTSCPNPLNTRSHGVLPAAILGTADLDVTEIDASTLRLEGVAPIRWDVEDVAAPYEPFIGKTNRDDCNEAGPDGIPDLTLKFDKKRIIAALGPVTSGDVVVLELTGNLLNGAAITGEDVVWIRP